VIFSFFCFLVLSAFLVCLGLFALAVTKVVAPDGKGHARGFVGGCAAMVALFLLCFLGVVGLAATVGTLALGKAADWNPVRSIEVFGDHEHDDERPWRTRRFDEPLPPSEHRAPAPRHSIYARFAVRGEAGADLAELLGRLIELDLDRLDDSLRVSTRTEEDGTETRLYEFRLPIREDELARFEENLRVELDGLRLRLPEGVRIEFEGTSD
jgi:hypothetical protein